MSMQLVSISLSAFYQNFDTFIVPTCTGTSPQAADVVGFTSVGVATEAIARGLSLQSGHTYYATIRGRNLYSIVCACTIKSFNITVNVCSFSLQLTILWDSGTMSYQAASQLTPVLPLWHLHGSRVPRTIPVALH